MEMKMGPALVLGACLLAGTAGAGFLVGKGIRDFRSSGRTVTVKGLAERQVTADLAVWNLRFKATGNDLADVQKRSEKDMLTVRAFLEKNGFVAADIQSSNSRVLDLFAREYGNERLPALRYIVEANIVVRTNKIDVVSAAAQNTGELIRQGIALDNDQYTANPSYYFTKLGDVRPQMLADATKSARLLAEQFAADSQSHVGGILRANQGTFQISALDQTDGGDMMNQQRSTAKLVRVVTTIDYLLVD